MIFLQIAWCNLLRSRRWTISTLISMVIGVSMMVFANGFNDGMSRQWADSLINRTEGHLKVRHRDFIKFGVSDMEKVLIREPEKLIAVIKQNPHVREVMPRVVTGGLVGKDDKTSTFVSYMDDLSLKDKVLPDQGKELVAGRPICMDDPDGVVVGKAMAESLNAGVGDELVLISNNIYGEMSAVLVHIRGLMTVQNKPDDEYRLLWGGLGKTMREDLFEIGQGATELVVRLDDTRNVEKTIEWLNRRFDGKSGAWVAVPWYSDDNYQFLMRIFNGIRIVIMLILSLIVGIVISNALMISIFERFREIGSMRAIGMQKRQVYALFYVEALLVICIGGFLGVNMGVFLAWLGGREGISIFGSFSAGVRPVIEPMNLALSFLAPMLFSCIAVFFPIRSSCKISVAESLYHN